MSRVFVKEWKFVLCALAVCVGFSVLFGRLVYLHVIDSEELSSLADANRRRMVEVDARRGDIVDRNGDLLAGTRTRVEVGMDPYEFKESDLSKLPFLAAVLEIDLKDLQEKAKNRFRKLDNGTLRPIRWVPLAVVDEPIYKAVENAGISAVYGNRRYERFYPGGSLASQILGFVNKEDTPVMGVERAMDFYLSGEDGWREYEVDGRRREIPAFQHQDVPSRNGYHVELTLDLYVQSVVEDTLRGIAETYNPSGASIIVSSAKTGEILGLGNYPSFDPNTFWDFPLANQRNRTVTDVYEPGSTFKIVTVAAALEEHLVQPSTIVDCGVPVVQYHNRSISLPSDHHDLGKIPVFEVVAKSSNRGAAQLGIQLGENRMYAYASSFGFGAKSGWPLGGEISGILHAVEDWDGLTISRLPTGYAVGATPMQVHLAMSTIANDGVRLPARLIRSISDADGTSILEFPKAEGTTIVSPETARMMREMLTRVVSTDGTARRAALPGFEVAGKTGTSRKIINGVYSTSNHFASFSGFFPSQDPEVVITVMVDDPQLDGPGYGGVVAAPAFREIGNRLIPHLAIKKPEPIESFVVVR